MSRPTTPLTLTTALLLAALAPATAKAAPTIPLTTISGPTTTSIVLEADINPQGTALEYHFEYGASDCASNPCTSTPVPNAKLGTGNTPIRVKAQIKDLTPGTTYHFRVVAKNVLAEKAESPDEIFATYAETPTFGPCPNDPFRKEKPSAKLPDCRAYEQASPQNKNGVDATGGIFLNQASLSGDAITSFSLSGIPGGVGASEFPLYIHRRVGDNWSTEGLLPPPSYGHKGFVLGWTPDLAYVFEEAIDYSQSSSTFLSRSSSEGLFETVVPHTPLAGYDFVGASVDGSKVFFEANNNFSGPGVDLTGDAAIGKPNLYRWDRVTEELSLVGVLPASQGAAAPPGGSFAGSYDWWRGTDATTLSRGGADRYYFTQEQHTASSDGDKAYYTAGNTGQIYLRKGLNGPTPSTAHVSAPQRTIGKDPLGPLPAVFQRATPDGSKAFFTSSEELTDDANTGPEQEPPAIARADIDGKPESVEMDFIPAKASAIAVDGAYIYWIDPEKETIARAKLDGTEVNDEFITGTDNPSDVEVDSTHIYWSNVAGGSVGTGTIGRADLDGNNVDQTFITGASEPLGIAVNDTHIFWSNTGTGFELGRADIDGGNVDQSFIIAGPFKGDVEVNPTHIYYSYQSGSVGVVRRRNLDGTGFFVNVAVTKQPPGTKAPRIALDVSHLYWTGITENTIGRVELLDESNPEKDHPGKEFIKNAGHPQGIAADASHLYWSANQEVAPSPGNDLYRYDAETGDLTDLTPLPTATNGADVIGVIGASDDGSYVYFAANGDLDGAGPATPGNCTEISSSYTATGACSLYLSHNGAISYVTRLDFSGGEAGDSANLSTNASISFYTTSTPSRVSADGQTLFFRSRRQQTSYDNKGAPQLYRYSHPEGEILCVSCNPTGVPASSPHLHSINTDPLAIGHGPFLLRSFSADGSRAFFETTAKLVIDDTNGDIACPQARGGIVAILTCQDVYEWEAEGSGSCENPGGCFYLISTGTSERPSYFADASASGDDVFFFTRDQLVPQDQDQLQDLYGASVGGGLASQNQPPPPPPCEGEACRKGSSAAPPQQGAGTPVFQGPGNPPVVRKKGCPKGKRKVRVRGGVRCVRKTTSKHRKANSTIRRASR